jgi:hypothetical protein
LLRPYTATDFELKDSWGYAPVWKRSGVAPATFHKGL